VNRAQEQHRIEDAVISCLCYFDVFKYPLNIREIHSFLPDVKLSLDSLKESIHSHPLNKFVVCTDDYYYLYNRDSSVISHRLRAERIAERRWSAAKRMTKIIKMFPFVRAVMISGDLSKNVSSNESDIDYFILTKPGTLWITRTLLILFKKTLLMNKRTYYCLNFFRTTNYMNFDSARDHFTATELVTLKPVFNSPVFGELLDANPWVYSYFPNYARNGTENKHTSDKRSFVQVILEKLLELFPLDRLDTRIMKYMEQTWRKRYFQLSADEVAYRFRCTKDESTAFVVESKRDILTQFSTRRRQLKELMYNEEKKNVKIGQLFFNH